MITEEEIRNQNIWDEVIKAADARTVLVVEISKESPHDGWYHIVGPNPPINPDGTYLKTNKQGWIEVAHVVDASKQKSNIVIEIDWEEQTWSAREG